MPKSKIFFIWAICFLAGIAVRSVINFNIFYLFILALMAIVAAVVFWQNIKWRWIFMAALFLFFGVWRVDLSDPKITADYLKFYDGQAVELTGRITSEPEVTEKYVKIILSDLLLNEQGNLKNVTGKILVNAEKYGQEFNFGEAVFIRCEIERPGVIEAKDKNARGFDYGRYLKGQDVDMVCYLPDTVIHAQRQLNLNWYENIYSYLLKAKQNFKVVIDKNMSLPESGLISAMILGYRREILPELNTAFGVTGLTHIIAISGLNITLIAALLFELLSAFGLSHQKSFWFGALILSFYVLMIGAFASATRALIMSLMFMYGLKIGRPAKIWNLILFAAVVLVIFNPFALMFDIGFQLSFFAIIGLMIFQPIFSQWLTFVPEKLQIRAMISMTLSAQVFTLPLIAYYFGRISLIAPLSNLLVLPVLPVLTAAGILMILLGLIWSKFAFALGIILHFIIAYIIFVVELLSKVPYASMNV